MTTDGLVQTWCRAVSGRDVVLFPVHIQEIRIFSHYVIQTAGMLAILGMHPAV